MSLAAYHAASAEALAAEALADVAAADEARRKAERTKEAFEDAATAAAMSLSSGAEVSTQSSHSTEMPHG